MKSFVTFTLAAGVALATASVVQAAGGTRGVQTKIDRTSNVASVPATVGVTTFSFDRAAFNRELSRISEILQPVTDDQLLLDEGTAVGRKSGTVWSF